MSEVFFSAFIKSERLSLISLGQPWSVLIGLEQSNQNVGLAGIIISGKTGYKITNHVRVGARDAIASKNTAW